MKQSVLNFTSSKNSFKAPEISGDGVMKIRKRNYGTLILIFTILFLGFSEGSKLQAQTTIVGWSSGFSFELTDNPTY